MLADASVRDLLDRFSSSDPTPGGGSASALASAIAAALLLMVTGLPRTRAGSDEDREALRAAATALDDLRRQLTDAVDADAAAYDQVVATFRLPKGTEPQLEARKAAIQEAKLGAARVPLAVMRLSAGVLAAAKTVAAHGARPAASDVGVAIALAWAGLHGARLNVETNLSGLEDRALEESLRADAARFVADGDRAAAEAEACLPDG